MNIFMETLASSFERLLLFFFETQLMQVAAARVRVAVRGSSKMLETEIFLLRSAMTAS